ncbi:UDP-3-O-acyl-N-acetylglucosamine deacetylase [Phreatobacter cathodiphilus]|uniref:UDP-3-O-acyl-N-acetylglucosamine deacetylase n=1 Tax=Phreatobacter cathodiphilus TaxID=1868589 RepID=A0A2S0NH36_9HYPH|nr:UDP-3-O-acyl-N-acetylglucosamine deacetylase [Phreatobacter cathodiphilus]AVO47448.1 UDP-3-O-[3-hydroxymyristoyl] N-acetylglucosamine deacetylase [Phreatobacter cathodiphilus]
MKPARQTTLHDAVQLDGIGVHSGAAVSVTLHPAEAGSGIAFLRSDQDHAEIPAVFRNVSSADLSTVIGKPERGGVATVEHLMAALAGLGIDNCLVEVDGPEMPILDGSAAPFVAAIDQAGIRTLDATRRMVKVLKSVVLETERGVVELHPHDRGLRLEVEIDFDNAMIGRQLFGMDLDAGAFRREVARARTFGFMQDVSRLWAVNKALGASLENTVVVGDDRILNPEGLRFRDEFVRHKLLDAVGDLSLAGAPLIGRFRSYRGGHRMNVKLLEALFADPTAYAIVEQTARRERGHADIGVSVAAYGPDAN